MNLPNYKNYGFTLYPSEKPTEYELGDVIINDENKVGVVIQIHSNDEFRVDHFGNTSSDEVRLATQWEIDTFRPNLLEEGTFKHN